VRAGILKPSDLLGWRGHDVFIIGSQHTPLNPAAVRDAMPTFFELLENENSPAVRAVLGHFVFVFIHPYMDGNGRLGRFLMNAMLASGGWPWTVMPVSMKKKYMAALESASSNQDIKPFARLICDLIPERKRAR
jgi:Fic family protein